MAVFLTVSPVLAQDPGHEGALDRYFARLADPGEVDWQRVEREIDRLLSLSGSPSADLLYQRGSAALEAQEVTEAIAHFTALTDHAPGFAEGWSARAAAYIAAGLYGPAMADLQQALTLEPRHFGALAGLGLLLEETGRPEAALAAFEAAIAIHPHHPELARSAARLRLAQRGSSL